ncbi:MAG: hypothetical protein WDW36_008494 [Sanguina aurantia]
MSGRVIADPATAAVHVAGKEGITSYHADRVFPAEVTQEEIYEGLGAEIVEFSCLGKSVMVFAYGQTGSGKTHTILGDMRIAGGEQRGLVPRMVTDLFTSLEEKASSQLPDMQRVHLVMTYLEIYNDTLKDLIANSAEDLAVRQVDSVFKVMGLREERAFTVESALRVLEAASARRRVAMTATNSQSSRSHSVLTLAMPSAGSSVTLVDLAGSEQYTSTDVQRAEEGTHVKKSLMNLGKIIRALAERRQPGVCIPGMRDSTLVKILMASADSDCFARARTHRGASSPPSCSLAQPG